jgi:hypothetical protein
MVRRALLTGHVGQEESVSARTISVLKLLVLCLLWGLLSFAGGTLRELIVAEKPVQAALESGLVTGLAMLAISTVIALLVLWNDDDSPGPEDPLRDNPEKSDPLPSESRCANDSKT